MSHPQSVFHPSSSNKIRCQFDSTWQPSIIIYDLREIRSLRLAWYSLGMRISKSFNKRRLITAFVGGVLSAGFYKLYVYSNNREQFEDSNMLVSVVFVLIATAAIFLILELISISKSSK